MVCEIVTWNSQHRSDLKRASLRRAMLQAKQQFGNAIIVNQEAERFSSYSQLFTRIAPYLQLASPGHGIAFWVPRSLASRIEYYCPTADIDAPTFAKRIGFMQIGGSLVIGVHAPHSVG